MGQHIPQCLLISALFVLLSACDTTPTLIDAIRSANQLRCAVISSTPGKSRSDSSTIGLEYELARRYAQWLGVKIRFVTVDNHSQLRKLVDLRKVHFGAAMLTVGRETIAPNRYGPTYHLMTNVVVHHRGQPWPQTKSDLIGWNGVVISDPTLENLARQEFPRNAGYSWKVENGSDIAGVLNSLADGNIDYGLLPSLDFKLARRNYPALREAFTIGFEYPVAWYLQTSSDQTLLSSQTAFFRELRETGEFDALYDRYFGHIDDYDYVESRALLRDYNARLPAFRQDFVAAGDRVSLDWRLLAALSYQESRWRNDAKSPTGVRGLMMLTQATADQLNVDRLDPSQSIDGGARYLRKIMDRIPERIDNPDRTWFALAAYNAGFRNMERARVITDKHGGDPDSWFAVRKHLPKIGRANSSHGRKQGYARGYQALHFVARVRQNYEVLKRLEIQNTDHSVFDYEERKTKLISPVF